MCKILQGKINFVATKLSTGFFLSSLKEFVLMKQCSQNWENRFYEPLMLCRGFFVFGVWFFFLILSIAKDLSFVVSLT